MLQMALKSPSLPLSLCKIAYSKKRVPILFSAFVASRFIYYATAQLVDQALVGELGPALPPLPDPAFAGALSQEEVHQDLRGYGQVHPVQELHAVSHPSREEDTGPEEDETPGT